MGRRARAEGPELSLASWENDGGFHVAHVYLFK